MKTRHQKNREKDHLARIKKKHRKEFFINLKLVCDSYVGFDLYSKFPTDCLEKIYKYRIRQFAIIDEERKYSSRDLQFANDMILRMCKTISVDLPNGRGHLPLSLQMVEGISLILCVKNLTDHEFPAASEIKRALSAYVEQDYYSIFHKRMNEMLFFLCVTLTEFDHGFSWGKLALKASNQSARYTFYLNKFAPVKEQFIVDNQSRPAYRVGWASPNGDMKWVGIKPSQLGQSRWGSNSPLPAFIQAHALLRLEERIGVPSSAMHHAVVVSLQSLAYHRDENGRLLINYEYSQKKIGYLVCSIEDKRVLIHTFLFLTNSGTPEGKNLFKLTGLQMMDKKYLAIDKLSTFLQYNIKDNEMVKNIFIEAGCGQLLEMEDEKPFIMNKHHPMSVESIANYLRSNLKSRQQSQ